MKAISFFSYKGGVGRTLALANTATRLVEFGKSVMILDFDLEAPGVPYKLHRYVKPNSINLGLVDYVYDFAKHGKLNDISNYIIDLPKNNVSDANLWLMPAGNNNIADYWKKLSGISWHDLFYKEGGSGLRFFLDLKEKIKKQYNPDYLLIDSRTGITELSGISLKILADELVILFVNNEENINGTERVLSFLYGNQSSSKDNLPVHLVLTRITKPKENSPDEFKREHKLVSSIKQRFAETINGLHFGIHVLHTDDRLQWNEQVAFSDKNRDVDAGIFVEHMSLFELIFKKDFSTQDWQKQQDKTTAAKFYNRALILFDNIEKITMLTEAIKLDDEKWEYYRERGISYHNMFDYSNAINDYKKAIQLNINGIFQEHNYLLLSDSLFYSNQHIEALEEINKCLKINPDYLQAINFKATIVEKTNGFEDALKYIEESITKYPKADILLNARANLLRKIGKYEESLKDIFKAIELSPNPVYYGTLAEIYGGQNKIEEFYLNLTTALSKGLNVYEIRTAKDAYEKFRHEPRFIELLESYNINSEDIFHKGPIIGVETSGSGS